MVSQNKWRTEFDDKSVIYSPFGLEKKHANRLLFCSLILLMLLFWFGAESLYHPQLIDNYTFYFIIIFVFVYTFGFYWIFIDLWKYSRIEVILQDANLVNIKDRATFGKNIDKMISFLKIQYFKEISVISFIIFLTINSVNILMSLLASNISIPFYQTRISLPGTGIESSEPLIVSIFIYGFLVIPPVVAFIFLVSIYKNINSFSKERLDTILNPLPKDIQIKVIENLKTLNKKFREELKIE